MTRFAERSVQGPLFIRQRPDSGHLGKSESRHGRIHCPEVEGGSVFGPERNARLQDQLLVANPDFADHIEIRLVGLKYEKVPHLDCWFKNHVGDV
jgi:hypothetical protein